MRLTWPLTGRSKEQRLIEAAIFDSDLAGVVVCGAAGVGKSRIAREALSSAGSRGCEVRWIVGTSSARSIPLAALSSWTESAGDDNLELIRNAIASLTSSSSGKTVVLGIDDVALLDDLSTFVVHQIIQRRAAKVLLTIRQGESIPAGVLELWDGGQLDRLDLQPLSEAETTALVSATLGGPVDPPAADRLWTLTRGNPLYLRNIVEQEVADERLVMQDDSWRWLGDPILPPSLIELVEGRIGGLPSSVSDVIDALAVGEPIELGSLTRITDSAAVEQADIRGLIALAQIGDRVEARLAHPLYGEVRRNRAAATRLRRLRGLIAAELAASDDRDEMHVVVRRATLSIDSDLEPDPDLLVRAASGAVWLWEFPLADRLAAAATLAGGAANAKLIRAYALSCTGRGEEADALLAGIQTGELADVMYGRMAFLQATNRLFTLADPAGAKEFIDEASRAAGPPARSCIDAFLTVYWAAMGKPHAAIESAGKFIWQELPDLVAQRVTAWALALAFGEAGRAGEAAAAAKAGYPVPIRSFVIITDAHIGALLLAGHIADADAPAQTIRERQIEFQAFQSFQVGSLALGRVALGSGRLDAAISLLAQSIETATASTDSNRWRYRCQIPLTTALAMRGSIDAAAARFGALGQLCHPSWRYLDYEYAIAKAWLAAGQGAVSEAIAISLAAAETAKDNGQFAPEVMCLQTATQFGERTCGPRLRELSAIVEGPRAGIAARFAEAMHDDNGTELAAVSAEFENMGDLIAAVDAAAHAALTYRHHDLRGSALGCSARAEALAEHCGGARTPALCKAVERLPLTDREREIVMLVGQGLSNRDVATRLTLSVRTVESHIYKAMSKTGTSSRDELAALLPQRRE
ncbi:LuxR C-terminal-related transcriptional regulator [Mycobacterium cookii]|uniref:LuxR family transcriptional regulator n=1 Tax=Mycobacterium cookii TaxID=1775 RepID=A0A7I7L114_9MYCO|nr:LuxR family transcriptional regulator [Mycobacterium cookii]MCV7333258.1 helix-turn-helix transcriptional regulator [Mycobacterium cookii]BBX47727.1 LuxR family transcriptional regulator [Mycobacterium cookii]